MTSNNPKWTKAAGLLAQGFPKAEVARRVIVSRNTINNWLAKPEFVALVDKAISDHVIQFTERAIRDRDLAQQTLVDVLEDPEATNSDKIRAATVLQNQGNKSTEMRALINRVNKLEEDRDAWTKLQEKLSD